jgi:hypothetical protein
VHDVREDDIFSHGRRTALHERYATDIVRWERLVAVIRWVNKMTAWAHTPSLYDMSMLNPFNVIPLRWAARAMGVSAEFWDVMVVPIYR